MHDDKIDIAKGFGIILMVIGHSGCFPILNHVIYLFHMPLFFFLGGWTFKEEYLDNKFKYFAHRLKKLYGTFVFYGLLFLLFHNLFCLLNFYRNAGPYTTQQLFYQAIKVLTFRGSDQLLGGYWFLKVLFFSSLLCLWSLFFVNKISFIKRKRLGKVVVFWGLLVAAVVASVIGVETKYIVASILFMIGSIIHENEDRFSRWELLLIFSTIILIVAAYIKPMSMMELNSPLLVLYYLSISLVGIYVIMNLSQMAVLWKIKKLLVYIGKNTMIILTFHMLSFKLVSLIKILHYNLPMSSLGEFPVIMRFNINYWILYSIIGISLPLGIFYFLGKAKNFITVFLLAKVKS
jgi:fucose 4-O-acetylase-like acetyltransferase